MNNNENANNFKEWYQITFSAKLDEDDIRAMKKYFYDAMAESMLIEECGDLEIKKETC